MSGLCGWFDSAQAGPVDPDVISTMARSITQFDEAATRKTAKNFGAVAVAAVGSDIDLFQGDDQIVAVWGRPHFNDANFAEIAQRHGIAQGLAHGYARNGTDVFAVLSGTFAVAILNGRSGEAVLAVDRLGTRPLCYAIAGSGFVFGSTLSAISAFPSIGSDINRQAIYDYVYFHMVPGPQCIQIGRSRLLPGTFVRWRNGKVESRAYWNMRYIENDERPFPNLKESFLDVLRQSVRGAAAHGTTGAFLSGGTDSSTIAGLLGEVTGEPARTYSIGFAESGYDEMEYARIAARHFGTQHHEYYVTPDDVVKAIPKIAAVHDQPFGNSSAVPTYYCAKIAKQDGIQTLLGGDGGDELFGGNDRYAKQHLYSLYSNLPPSLRKGLIEPIAFAFPEISVIGKAQRYMRYASLPMPVRYDHYNLLERLGSTVVFTREFLDTVNQNLPASQMALSYQSEQAQSLINRMLSLDLKYTLADNDLPKVARSCELAGVEACFPLLDDAVVAFSGRLEPHLKLKGTQLRYFFKKALQDFLPNEIIVKTKHGFGLPFGPWLQTHKPLKEIALDSLNDLKRRSIVRAEFIDELTSVHLNTHAGYYGSMVWILMMLEQWFKQHPRMV